MIRRLGLTGGSGVLGGVLQQSWRDIEWRRFGRDICDFESVLQWAQANADVESVLHLAAVVPTAQVDHDLLAAFRTNASGTLHLFEALRRTAARPWIFLASTSHVYAPRDEPVTETTSPAPISFYGATKLQAELVATAYARFCGFAVCVGRIFSYTAARQPDSFLLPSLRKRIAAAGPGATIALRGGNQVRDFIPARSIASAIALLADKRAEGIYNIGSGSGVTITDLARRVAQKLGRPDVRIVAASDERGRLVANIERLLALGWEGSGPIDEVIEG